MVLDNLNTHSGTSFYEIFPPQEARRWLERVEFVHTPKHGKLAQHGRGGVQRFATSVPRVRIPNPETLQEKSTLGSNTETPVRSVQTGNSRQ